VIVIAFSFSVRGCFRAALHGLHERRIDVVLGHEAQLEPRSLESQLYWSGV